MTYNACVKKVMDELSALPPKWAEKLACNICGMVQTEDECSDPPACDDIRECQTVTSLTDFEVTGNTVCISFTDERGVRVKRCFAFSRLMNDIDDTDGTCLSPLWTNLTPSEKWQSIIDKICLCCHPTTTTTTTTSSTTTTTTFPSTCDCKTFLMYNPEGNSNPFSYKECDSDTVFPVNLPGGQTYRFCACSEKDITYDPLHLVLSIINDQGCIPDPVCDSCNQYIVVNNNAFPIEVFYIDCFTFLPASIWVPAIQKGLIECACTNSIVEQIGLEILVTLDCPTTTTTTTAEPPEAPCRCYKVANLTSDVDRFLTYTDCDEIVHTNVLVYPGQEIYVCAKQGFISGFGLTITVHNIHCDDGCSADVTTSTTTTTTEEPTTTTTTTIAPTTTSTTTTTTTVPIEEFAYPYFTNRGTAGNRGGKMWFSVNNYYTPNEPFNVIASNCLSPVHLGTNPAIGLTMNYWTDDVDPSIDDGGGGVRAADGVISVSINGDFLVYNGSTGAWQKGIGVFSFSGGLNIAAFEITGVPSPFTYNGTTYTFLVPPVHNFIRVHNTFSAGGTDVVWFDL